MSWQDSVCLEVSCRYTVRALVRRSGQLAAVREGRCEEAVGDVLRPESLQSVCHDCDAVASCVGGRYSFALARCTEVPARAGKAWHIHGAHSCVLCDAREVLLTMHTCFLQPHGCVQHPGGASSHGRGQSGALSGGACRRRLSLPDDFQPQLCRLPLAVRGEVSLGTSRIGFIADSELRSVDTCVPQSKTFKLVCIKCAPHHRVAHALAMGGDFACWVAVAVPYSEPNSCSPDDTVSSATGLQSAGGGNRSYHGASRAGRTETRRRRHCLYSGCAVWLLQGL